MATEKTTRSFRSKNGEHEFTFCNECNHWDKNWKLFARLDKCECCVEKFSTAEIDVLKQNKPERKSTARSDSPSEQAQYMRDYRERKRKEAEAGNAA